MNTTTLSLRIDPELKQFLVDLGANQDRSISYIVNEVLTKYSELQKEQQAGILEALESLDRGEYIEHADVMSWLDSWGTANHQEPPRPMISVCK